MSTNANIPPAKMPLGTKLAIGVAVVIFILLGGVFVEAMISPSRPFVRASSTGYSSAPASYQVTYRVAGYKSSGSITYANAGGDTEMRGEEYFSDAQPWEKTFSAKPGAFVYVSVQNKKDYGVVSCAILLNGTVLKESRSEGAYVIASCSGSL
jgi:hypothetical protein